MNKHGFETKYINFTRTWDWDLTDQPTPPVQPKSSSIECKYGDLQVRFYMARVAGYLNVSVTDKPEHEDVIDTLYLGDAFYQAWLDEYEDAALAAAKKMIERREAK